MKKIYSPLAIGILSLIALFTSCTERLDINTGSIEPTVSVYAELSSEKKIQTVAVKMTAPYFSTEPNKPVTDAVVSVTGGGESWVLDYTENGIYATTYEVAAKPGYTYMLSIECDYDSDGEADIFTASATVPVNLGLDKIEFDKLSAGGMTMYYCNLYTYVPQGYRHALYRYEINGEAVMTEISDTRVVDIKMWLSKDYIDGLMCDMFHSKKDMDKFDEDQIEKIYFLDKGDNVTMLMSMVDKDFFDFISQCQSEMNGENPIFGGPASNIRTNITNGGVGYFGAVNFSRTSTIVE